MQNSTTNLIEDLSFAFPPKETNEFSQILWAAITSLLVAALILLVVRQWRKSLALAKIRLPHEIALEEIAKLHSLLQTEHAREFVIQISSIIRIYIESRFDIHAPNQATEEFLAEAQKSQILSNEHQISLSQFLKSCDLVKFADYKPALKELQQTYDTAKQFVQETIPAVIDRKEFAKVEKQKALQTHEH
jgi:hypothetical protein